MTRLIDRSRITKDWTCPRARYWNYEFGGTGIAKESTSLALFTGISVHDSLATIAEFTRRGEEVPIDMIAGDAFIQIKTSLMEAGDGEIGVLDYANEQASLTEGMIRGFYQQVWPRLLLAYPKIIAIEQEMEYDLGGDVVFMAKPDLILENEEGEWVYIEFKTTSSKKPEWINSWETAVQLHSSVKATEQTLGKAPTSVQIVGLYKGYKSYGKQSSPFCYAYKRNGNPPFTQDQIEYEYKVGFKRYPTWELEGGVKKWVDEMPEEVLQDLFPMTPPIYVNDEMVEAFFRQTRNREDQIASFHTHEEDLLDKVFPQKFESCSPPWGFGCEFKKLCFGGCRNPLTEGFVVRTPHHSREQEEWDASS